MKMLLNAILFLTVLAGAALAHPLGNFSINQFARIEPARDSISVSYVVELAEIPTFAAAAEIDADGDGAFSDEELRKYANRTAAAAVSGLRLRVDGKAVDLTVEASTAESAAADGGLRTLRIESRLRGWIPESDDPRTLDFENLNHADRIGWNELVLRPAPGLSVFDSNGFGDGFSDELRAFPDNGFGAPLDERSVKATFAPGERLEGSVPLRNRDGRQTKSVRRDALAELISVREVTPALATLGLLLAFGLGALHAMSPGHGKTVVGAYLVGSRGTVKHALFLGLTVTATHTIGVFVLGGVTLFASNYVVPERILPFLSFVSGLLVFYIGATMFSSRVRAYFRPGGSEDAHHHHHDHPHEDHSHGGVVHSHGGRTHSHLPPEKITWRGLIILGISGGLLPCPSALVLMLSSISLGRTGFGIVLTAAFSLGLAATLTAVGLVFLFVGRAMGGTRFADSRIVRLLPVASAFVIACIGAVICWDGFRANL